MKKAIQKLSIFLTVFCLLFAIVPVQAAAPAISKKTATIYVGKSITLKMNDTKAKVKWKTSNSKIATVSGTGKVTGKKTGTAKITATVNKKNYSCTITVKKASTKVKVSKISLNKTAISLNVGTNYSLKASVSPAKAANKAITWKSSNTGVATVNSNGTVTAKKAGTATITATAKDGSGKKSICKVTVKEPRITKLSISSKKSVNVNGTLQLTVSAQPSNLKKTFTWKSNNSKIATVSNKGLVKGISAGTVKITVTTNDKWKDSISVYITVNKTSTPNPAPQKKTSGIEAVCTLKEVGSVNDVNSSNLTVYEKFSDGTKTELRNYSVKGEYIASSNSYKYTISKTGTNFSTVLIIPKQKVTKTLEKITAECLLKEVDSINEVDSSNIKVIGYYSDGSTSELKAYNLSLLFDENQNKYQFTVETTDGRLSTKFYVKLKRSASDIKLNDIEVSCKLAEVEEGYHFKTSDFIVKGIYSDGSTNNIGFKVDISYSDGTYKATITAGGFTKTLSIPVKKKSEPTVTSLSYSLNPSYVYVGEKLAAGQLKVTENYSDGTQKEITDYTTTFSPQTTAGTYNFDVLWKDIKKTLSITIREKETPKPTLTGLDASFNRNYIYSDETPSADDIVLIGTYSDGSTKRITDYTYDFSPASGHLQKATLTIHYVGKDMVIHITSIVKTEPKSVEFKFVNAPIGVGEEIDRKNITLSVTDYAGNVTNPTDFTIDFSPKAEAGTYSFSVSYRGFSETFQVTVIAKE